MASANIPADAEAERGLLSAMMDKHGGADAIASAVHRVGNDVGEWFNTSANQTIFSALVSEWQQGIAFDLIMFTGRLRDARILETVGGASYVTGLLTMMCPGSMAEMYLSRLADKRWLRHVYQTGAEIAKVASSNQDDVNHVLRTVETALLKIVARDGKKKSHAVKRLVAEVIADLGEPEKILGISTGWPHLDEVVGGLAEGAKIVLAGPISGGKSAFAECMAESLGVTRQIPTAMFTFEMSAKQKVQRLIQIRSEVSVRSIARQEAEMFEFDAFRDAAKEISTSKLWIIEDRLDVAGIRSRCLQLKPRVAIIDYLQIVPEQKNRGESTTEKLDRMSAETKQIAHDLGITVIELSQLTTDEKTGKVKTRYSQGITADADQLWVIEGEDDEAKEVIPKNIVIAKQRDGMRKHVPFMFVKNITKFRARKN